MSKNDSADISVCMLCRQAFVARSTFYAYYKNTDKLLETIEDRLIGALLRKNEPIMYRGIHQRERLIFYQGTLEYIKENEASFYVLLITRMNHRFIEKWKMAVKYHFWERLFAEHLVKNSGLILEMVSSVVIVSYSYWLKHPEEIDLEGIYTIVADILKRLDDGI